MDISKIQFTSDKEKEEFQAWIKAPVIFNMVYGSDLNVDNETIYDVFKSEQNRAIEGWNRANYEIFNFLSKKCKEEAVTDTQALDREYKQALNIFKTHIDVGTAKIMQLAHENYPPAMIHASNFLAHGLFLNVNHKLAFQYAEKAFKLDYKGGLSFLAFLYAKGIGCTRDRTKANRLLTEAKELGLIENACYLAYCLAVGLCIDRNQDAAIELFFRAINNNDYEAGALMYRLCIDDVFYYDINQNDEPLRNGIEQRDPYTLFIMASNALHFSTTMVNSDLQRDPEQDFTIAAKLFDSLNSIGFPLAPLYLTGEYKLYNGKTISMSDIDNIEVPNDDALLDFAETRLQSHYDWLNIFIDINSAYKQKNYYGPNNDFLSQPNRYLDFLNKQSVYEYLNNRLLEAEQLLFTDCPKGVNIILSNASIGHVPSMKRAAELYYDGLFLHRDYDSAKLIIGRIIDLEADNSVAPLDVLIFSKRFIQGEYDEDKGYDREKVTENYITTRAKLAKQTFDDTNARFIGLLYALGLMKKEESAPDNKLNAKYFFDKAKEHGHYDFVFDYIECVHNGMIEADTYDYYSVFKELLGKRYPPACHAYAVSLLEYVKDVASEDPKEVQKTIDEAIKILKYTFSLGYYTTIRFLVQDPEFKKHDGTVFHVTDFMK